MWWMTWYGVYYGSISRVWWMTWDGVYYGSINGEEGCGGWHEKEFIMVVSIEKDVVDDMRWSLLW